MSDFFDKVKSGLFSDKDKCCPDDIFVTAAALNGTLLELTRNDGIVVSIDLASLSGGGDTVQALNFNPLSYILELVTDQAVWQQNLSVLKDDNVVSFSYDVPSNVLTLTTDQASFPVDLSDLEDDNITAFAFNPGTNELTITTDQAAWMVDLSALDVVGDTITAFNYVDATHILTITTDQGSFPVDLSSLDDDEVTAFTYDPGTYILTITTESSSFPVNLSSLYTTIPDTLFVDVNSGDDATAVREDPSLPFKTLYAAIAASVSGDRVIVTGGTDSINGDGLDPGTRKWAKDGVTVVCSEGVTLLLESNSTSQPFNLSGAADFQLLGYPDLDDNRDTAGGYTGLEVGGDGETVVYMEIGSHSCEVGFKLIDHAVFNLSYNQITTVGEGSFFQVATTGLVKSQIRIYQPFGVEESSGGASGDHPSIVFTNQPTSTYKLDIYIKGHKYDRDLSSGSAVYDFSDALLRESKIEIIANDRKNAVEPLNQADEGALFRATGDWEAVKLKILAKHDGALALTSGLALSQESQITLEGTIDKVVGTTGWTGLMTGKAKILLGITTEHTIHCQDEPGIKYCGHIHYLGDEGFAIAADDDVVAGATFEDLFIDGWDYVGASSTMDYVFGGTGVVTNKANPNVAGVYANAALGDFDSTYVSTTNIELVENNPAFRFNS
jgi:hypothetical protein